MIPENEREALMRLTMCAREECSICKFYEASSDCCDDLITDNMNILDSALDNDNQNCLVQPQKWFRDYGPLIKRQAANNSSNDQNGEHIDGILFKGELKEGHYELIKTTDGWALSGQTIAYYGEQIGESSNDNNNNS